MTAAARGSVDPAVAALPLLRPANGVFLALIVMAAELLVDVACIPFMHDFGATPRLMVGC